MDSAFSNNVPSSNPASSQSAGLAQGSGGTTNGSYPGNPLVCLSNLGFPGGLSVAEQKTVNMTGNGLVVGDVFLLGSNPVRMVGNAAMSGPVYYNSLESNPAVTLDGNPSLATPAAADLSSLEAALQNLAKSAAADVATQSIDSLSLTAGVQNTLVSQAPVNVIDVANPISLEGQSDLHFSGSASDIFIVRIAGGIKVAGGASITVSGALQASHVLFLLQNNGALELVGGSVTVGTYIVPGGVTLHGGAFLTGAVFSEDDVVITGNGTINVNPGSFCSN